MNHEVDEIKVTRIDIEEYAVTLNGVQVGTVAKGWWRLGGTGWGHSLSKVSNGFHVDNTRKGAVADMVRRYKRSQVTQ